MVVVAIKRFICLSCLVQQTKYKTQKPLHLSEFCSHRTCIHLNASHSITKRYFQKYYWQIFTTLNSVQSSVSKHRKTLCFYGKRVTVFFLIRKRRQKFQEGKKNPSRIISIETTLSVRLQSYRNYRRTSIPVEQRPTNITKRFAISKIYLLHYKYRKNRLIELIRYTLNQLVKSFLYVHIVFFTIYITLQFDIDILES